MQIAANLPLGESIVRALKLDESKWVNFSSVFSKIINELMNNKRDTWAAEEASEKN